MRMKILNNMIFKKANIKINIKSIMKMLNDKIDILSQRNTMKSYEMWCCNGIWWLCLMSHRQRSPLKMAQQFTVPCKGCKARFLHPPHREVNSGSLHGSPLTNHCTKPAPLPEWKAMPQIQDMISTVAFFFRKVKECSLQDEWLCLTDEEVVIKDNLDCTWSQWAVASKEKWCQIWLGIFTIYMQLH